MAEHASRIGAAHQPPDSGRFGGSQETDARRRRASSPAMSRFSAGAVLFSAWMMSAAAAAQIAHGTVMGRVRDPRGAPVEGALVVLGGDPLLEDRTTITSASGRFWFDRVPPGRYTLRVEAPVAASTQRGVPPGPSAETTAEIEVELGMTTEVLLELPGPRAGTPPSGSVPVAYATGLPLATLGFSTGKTVDREWLQALPVARDAWGAIDLTPGVVWDGPAPAGLGGRAEPVWAARGGSLDRAWSVDGFDLTDPATSTSPIAFDADTFEQLRIQTGGHDLAVQTSGGSVNIVTRSGGNIFRAGSRAYWSGRALSASNLNADMRQAMVSAGDIGLDSGEFGVEGGGPLRRERAWFHGSYGGERRQTALFGVPTGGDYSGRDPYDPNTLVRESMAVDTTTGRVDVVPRRGQRLTVHASANGKRRHPVGLSRHDAPESWNRRTGTAPILRLTDQFSAKRFVVAIGASWADTSYEHDLWSPDLGRIQPARDLATDGWWRSGRWTRYERRSFEVKGEAVWRASTARLGDHAIRIGARHTRRADGETSHVSGFATANFMKGLPAGAALYRDGARRHRQWSHAAWLSDTISWNRVTVEAGLRFDSQADRSGPAGVAENPLLPEALPAAGVGAISTGVSYRDLAPRAGVSWDAGGGRTILKLHAGRYFGSGIYTSAWLDPSGSSSTNWPWSDPNRDGFVQREELVPSALTVVIRPIPLGPSYNVVARDLDNGRTAEVVASIEHRTSGGFLLATSYIYRRDAGGHRWFLNGVTSADFREVTVAIERCDQGRCGPGSRTVTYYDLPFEPPPGRAVVTARDYLSYHGVEFTALRRFGRLARLDGSLTFGRLARHYPGPDSYQDPTRIAFENGRGPASLNARWVAKLAGTAALPGGLATALVVTGRDGYPFVRAMYVSHRLHLAAVAVPLEPIGTTRYDSVWTIDWRLARSFRVGRSRVEASLEVFNLANSAVVLRRETYQNYTRANAPLEIAPPRAGRVGVRVGF